MTAYLITSFVLFLLLCFIWTRKDWLNLFIKFGFFLMAGWSGFLALEAFGYIVKG